MGTTAPITVQDYLRDFGDSSCEYVDGVVIEKPKPTWMHSVLQGWLGGLIMRLYPHYLAGSETHSASCYASKSFLRTTAWPKRSPSARSITIGVFQSVG